MVYDTIIIGAGPAGVSAALYAIRARLSVLMIGKVGGALLKAGRIDNYYGFPDGIGGLDLLNAGIAQAKRLGVVALDEEVVGLDYLANFIAETKDAKYEGKSVIIATGASRVAPPVKNIARYEGKGVSFCAVCDGFFHRDQPVAVLGNGVYALAEATHLLSIASRVYLLTDGREPDEKVPEGIEVIQEKVSEVYGENEVEGVAFQNGDKLALDGLFIAYGVAGSVDLARKIGAGVENNKIKVDEKMRTNIPYLYAAGDCVGGLFQINKAVHDGCVAASTAIVELKSRGK